MLLVAVTACRTTAPRAPRSVPDPLAPAPAGSVPTADVRTAVYGALAAAARGDRPAAERLLAGLAPEDPVTRLARLEAEFLLGSVDVGALAALAGEQPGWVPAWEMLEAAGQRVGAVDVVLRATRHLAEVAPSRERREAVERAEAALADRALEAADREMNAGQYAAALRTAGDALELVPAADVLRVVLARAYLGLGRVEDAAGLVPALPDSEAGLRVKGEVAGALGQWDLAESFYERLPEGAPGRCRLLTEARLRTRLANAPPYVREALASPRLRRHQLAALAVLEVPELARLGRGRLVVYEDVVQLADAGDVAVVARAGLMTGDPVARRFDPEKKVSSAELREVLDRLADLLERPRIDWCDAADEPGCVAEPERIDGAAADALIRRVAEKGEEQCSSP